MSRLFAYRRRILRMACAFAAIGSAALLCATAAVREVGVSGRLDLTGYKLTFDDEFNDLSASPDGVATTWETKYFWGGRQLSGASDYYLDESVGGVGQTPYSVANGVLNIHARPTSPELKAAGVTAAFTTGQIDTHNSFSQTYGYFEMRAQVSGTRGTNSAFWLLPRSGAWPPEIDVAEVLGRDPRTDVITNHTAASRTTAYRTTATTGGDLSHGFHTYGLMWTPTTMTFYLDGAVKYTTPTQADEHQPMYILATLGVGGSWAGNPSPANFNAEMKIDYVRAYSNDPYATAVEPQPGWTSEHGAAAATATRADAASRRSQQDMEATGGYDLDPAPSR
jgi:beta-glucanase (GH16 family)